MQTPDIAVVGCGYWGRNLVRNFHELGVLRTVCDCKQESLDEVVVGKYAVATTTDYASVLTDSQVKGVVIATPAARHYEMTRQALLSGKDVYVEKPLTLQTSQAEELVELAGKLDRILMVGHILEYHPAILELKRLIRTGQLGRINYIYSSRLNMGKLRTEEDILFSFAPHDVSAILFLLDESPVRVASHGGSYIDSHIVDTTVTTCDFKSGVKAHVFVSWLHPFKEQKLTIVGGKKMAVFDDTEPENKLVLYSHQIEWLDRVPVARKNGHEVVPLPKEEPLRSACKHFVECVQTRQRPRTHGATGVQVLRILEACERSLRESGKMVEASSAYRAYFAHPTAVVDDGCVIGAGTKIWHFSHVMAGCTIGENCNLGQNVVVSPEVRIGKNVKIQNNVSVYTGVELEDNVFCGPSMVFTNVINPRSHVIRRHEYRRTLVREGASIGANATIVCGVTLGRYSFVGAGAVVTRDVPDYGLVMGAPAKLTGFMCNCGIRLPQGKEPACKSCGRQYKLIGTSLTETEQPKLATIAA